MKAFELAPKTRLKLTKATPHKEFAGDERRQAISLRLRWETTNESLAKLHPNLKDMLFYRSAPVEAQEAFDVVPAVTPNLRAPIVEQPLKLQLEHSGCTFVIDYGLGAERDSDLELYDCTVKKFTAEGKEGGTALIEFSLHSHNEITPELIGALCDLEGSEIEATLIAPEAKADPVPAAGSHGGGDLFPEDDSDAGKAGSGVIDGTNADGSWPFPGDGADTPEGALAAAVAGDDGRGEVLE